MSIRLGPVKAPDLKRATDRMRRAGRYLTKPTSIVLLAIMLSATLLPILLTMDQGSQPGAIIGSLDDPSDTDVGDAGDGTGTGDVQEFEIGARSSNLTVEESSDAYIVRAEEYSITAQQQGRFVDYCISPYFTDDVIHYRRVNPVTASEGTVDENGNDLNWVTTTITEWGRDGDVIWFLESCDQFSLKQSFTIYRDYFELDVTYIPGTSNAVVSYFIGLYSKDGSMYDMFEDGVSHRYIPGVPVDTPSSDGIGGWYPAYEMFAPAFDMRASGSTLGVEWGFDETAAYLYSPVWMNDMGGGGPSVFVVKFTSTDSILPNPGLGTEQTWSMFVRPYEYTDDEPRGHDAGYAQWVAPRIAAEYDTVHTEQFPLTFNDFGQSGDWDAAIRSWVESSPILVATLSNNPDQVNWHYKSSQQLVSGTASMPTEWQLWSSPGQQYYTSAGKPVANAASSAYRDYLINGDPYNDWWWSTTGVFWDEMNSWYGENNLPRSDYNERQDFILDGYIKLVEETRASGHFDFVITNPFTPQIQLAMVSDLVVVEGFEAVPGYNMELKDHVVSMMMFVNEIPEDCRPHILVYQNYDSGSSADQWAVYSALFNAARYGFSIDLLSYSSYSSQLHNLQMAVDMFTAMGAERNKDATITPATLDMGSEGTVISTNGPMVVLTGSGTPTITFTGEHQAYCLSNLWGSATTFDMVLPAGSYQVQGDGITQVGDLTYLSDGSVVFHGTIGAESTGSIVRA